jgi:hypothetical protein
MPDFNEHRVSRNVAGSAGSTGGEFTTKEQSAAELTLLALPGLNTHSGRNGFHSSTPEQVTVVESPISDNGERNYWVALKDGGNISFNVADSGIADSRTDMWVEREELLLYREGDEVTVQYFGEPEDYTYIAEDLDAETIADIEQELRNTLRDGVHKIDVDFTSDNTWDSVHGYCTETSYQMEEQDYIRGLHSVHTTNVMFLLEANNPDYRSIRYGIVAQTFNTILRNRGLL